MLSPRTTSTSGTVGTGARKCRPITRSGRFVRAAISVTERAEVLEARMSSGGHTRSSSWKMAAFSSRSSGTASITSCDASRAARSSTGFTRAWIAFFSDAVRRHFAMSRSSASPTHSRACPRQLGRAVVQEDVEAGGGAGDRDALPHGAAAHDADAADVHAVAARRDGGRGHELAAEPAHGAELVVARGDEPLQRERRAARGAGGRGRRRRRGTARPSRCGRLPAARARSRPRGRRRRGRGR